MLTALHWDGFVLLAASLALVFIGHDYRKWAYRVPVMALAFNDFALAVNILGIARPSALAPWFVWRLAADTATLGIVLLYFVARPKHTARA